jgi:hypothetical protein
MRLRAKHQEGRAIDIKGVLSVVANKARKRRLRVQRDRCQCQ